MTSEFEFRSVVKSEYDTIAVTFMDGVVWHYKMDSKGQLIQGRIVKYPGVIAEGVIVMYAPSAAYSIPWFVALEMDGK